MVEILTSPKGLTYAKVNGVSLHSKYSPEKESLHFIQKKIIKKPSVIIILGPGIGYLIEHALQYYPDAKIISVFYHQDFFSRFFPKSDRCHLYSTPGRLRSFISRHITDLDLEGAVILEWPQSASLFPTVSMEVNSTIRDIFLELRNNFITTDSFGKRLIHNSIMNYIFLENIVQFNPASKPLIIAASGPSLEKSVSFLRRVQKNAHIIALPSSVNFLTFHGIDFQAVLCTDPGFYAWAHNYSIYTGYSSSKTLIKSISSAFSSPLQNSDTVLIGSTSFFEHPFLSEIYGKSVCSIPENGTVAGTALSVTDYLSSPLTFFIGLDFSYSDLLSHARPHPFYSMFYSAQNRFLPFHTTLFSRKSSFMEKSKAFDVYCSWFNNRIEYYRGRIFRLFPANKKLLFPPPIFENDAISLINEISDKIPDRSLFTKTHSADINRYDRISFAYKLVSFWITLLASDNQKPADFTEIENNPLRMNLLYFINPIKLKKLKRLSIEHDNNYTNRYFDLLNEARSYFIKYEGWFRNL